MLYSNRQLIMDRVAVLRLPTMYQWPETAEEGGFIGYGPRLLKIFRDVLPRKLAQLFCRIALILWERVCIKRSSVSGAVL